jgi:hypothetical protein
MRLRPGWVALALLLLALAGGITLLSLLRASPEEVWSEVSARTPGELVRYLKRRLEHHGKLEAVFVPALDWVQRNFERPVDLASIPTLGKGQRVQAGVAAVSALDLYVSTVEELREAMRVATAGRTIILAPGTYKVSQRLRTGNGGTAAQPIVIRPAERGTVWMSVTATMGIRMTQPYWVVEGLNWRGECTSHDDCEHALQIVGEAHHVTVRDNLMQDFNAHIKVNGENGVFPDHGRIVFNSLNNSAPRNTLRSVVPIDIVAASGWQVSDNVINDFIKSGGNRTSFGAFMKGAGSGGRFERNLVVCTSRGISQPGTRVGISLGGGGTGLPSCRDGRCVTEHEDGIVQDNVVAHCNDSGIDINTAARSVVRHNTLINTAGIQLRGDPTSATVTGNLLDGHIGIRPGSTLDESGNLKVDTREVFRDADGLDLAWLGARQPAGAR